MYNFEAAEIQKLLTMLEAGDLTKGEFRSALLKLLASPPSSQGTRPDAQPVRRGVPRLDSEYKVAQLMTTVQLCTGGLFTVFGIYVFFYGISTSGMYTEFGIFAGIISALCGVSIIGASQLMKAMIDMADYSREIYHVLYSRLP